MSAFQITGQKELSAFFERLGDRAKDPRVRELIGQLGARGCQRNIDRQASPDGTAYAPTKRGGTILRDKGTLYNGITYEVDAESVLIGAGAVTEAYNAYQQFGSKAGRATATTSKGKKVKVQAKGNPARPFIGLSDAELLDIEENVADFLVELDK